MKSTIETKPIPEPFGRGLRGTQKLETRRRILDAALRIFGREGILASTTGAVASEAGVSHGSVFVHFGTQEGLISAVIEDFGEALALRLHELTKTGAGTRAVLGAQLAAIGEVEDFYATLVVETPLLPPAARNSLVCIQSDIAFHLAPAIEADEGAGRIKAMPLPLLFNTWIGLVHYYLANRELFAPGVSLVEARGSELLDHFMSLISKEEEDERESHGKVQGRGARGVRGIQRPSRGHLRP